MNATKHQFDQEAFEVVGQQREQEDRQVGYVTHVTQDRGHDLPLRGLSHALNGGEQQDGLNHLGKTKHSNGECE